MEATTDTRGALGCHISQGLLRRDEVMRPVFAREAERLALACREMSERFLRGGRLLAFGRGPYATDAQHVSVEFVHPVIVGKRALPALDISAQFQAWLETLLGPDDMVMGFGPPEGDPDVWRALDAAGRRGAMTFALPGVGGSYALMPSTDDPFIHQELIEVLYHTLWETVHVFFEHRELGHDVGEAGFLYPFLGKHRQSTDDVISRAAQSILMKVDDDAALRATVAADHSDLIAQATLAIAHRIAQGGKLLLFGNGGSATDATDWAIDCVLPPKDCRAVPALSLSLEPATLTAIANDVGTDVVFLRQLIAHGRRGDVAVAISTSGGSRNIVVALEEARKRGLLTVALLGNDGGEVVRRTLADFPIVVHSDFIPRTQEVHASIYHMMRESLELVARG